MAPTDAFQKEGFGSPQRGAQRVYGGGGEELMYLQNMIENNIKETILRKPLAKELANRSDVTHTTSNVHEVLFSDMFFCSLTYATKLFTDSVTRYANMYSISYVFDLTTQSVCRLWFVIEEIAF